VKHNEDPDGTKETMHKGILPKQVCELKFTDRVGYVSLFFFFGT
jgi:hypothetical protein